MVLRGKVSPSKITPEGISLVAALNYTLTTTLFPGKSQRLSKGGGFYKCSLMQGHEASWTDRGEAKGLKIQLDLEGGQGVE